MSQKNINKQEDLPKLSAILFCQKAITSQEDGLKSAINIFTNINIAVSEASAPLSVRIPFVLITILANIKPSTNYLININLFSPSRKKLLDEVCDIRSEGNKEKLNHAEITLPLDLLITEAGEYLLVVNHKDQVIGETTLSISVVEEGESHE